MKLSKLLCIFVIFLLFSCTHNSALINNLQSINKSIETKYVPDKRVAIYHITFKIKDNKIIVSGKTDSKKPYLKLLDSLKSLNLSIVNKIRVLPDTIIGEKMYAVGRNSVINIRSQPKHSAELATQGLLGMPLNVLDKADAFYQVKTPDNYISWVDKGGITIMNKEEFDLWNTSKKVIFTKIFGFVYSQNNTLTSTVSDITFGGLLQYISEDKLFYKVKYPDNRIGFIKKKEAAIYKNWLQKLLPSQKNIEIAAKKMEGFPYLWGGTSTKGIDCSGFTKTVYLMNGFIIPRDASQQINAGKTVDIDLNFKGLEKGDLLFFGKKATEENKQQVTHVGIWLGNKKMEFIQSASNVHISSMDETQPNYDAFNKNRYLGSKRYLGVVDKNIIDLKK